MKKNLFLVFMAGFIFYTKAMEEATVEISRFALPAIKVSGLLTRLSVLQGDQEMVKLGVPASQVTNCKKILMSLEYAAVDVEGNIQKSIPDIVLSVVEPLMVSGAIFDGDIQKFLKDLEFGLHDVEISACTNFSAKKCCIICKTESEPKEIVSSYFIVPHYLGDRLKVLTSLFVLVNDYKSNTLEYADDEMVPCQKRQRTEKNFVIPCEHDIEDLKAQEYILGSLVSSSDKTKQLSTLLYQMALLPSLENERIIRKCSQYGWNDLLDNPLHTWICTVQDEQKRLIENMAGGSHDIYDQLSENDRITIAHYAKEITFPLFRKLKVFNNRLVYALIKPNIVLEHDPIKISHPCCEDIEKEWVYKIQQPVTQYQGIYIGCFGKHENGSVCWYSWLYDKKQKELESYVLCEKIHAHKNGLDGLGNDYDSAKSIYSTYSLEDLGKIFGGVIRTGYGDTFVIEKRDEKGIQYWELIKTNLRQLADEANNKPLRDFVL
jgi:hypothetical protein